MQKGNTCGWLPLIIRIGLGVSICGFAVHTLYRGKSNDPMSPNYILPHFNRMKKPHKCRLLRNIGRYERTVSSKKRSVGNDDTMLAARSLIELAEDGNASQFCEPHSGTASSTTMAIQDIEQLEVGCRTMQNENCWLHSECEWLEMENKRQIEEYSSLRKEHCAVLERCETLKILKHWLIVN